MATATELYFASDIQRLTQNASPAPLQSINGLGADEWAELLRNELQNLAFQEPIDPKCLSAPRRKHANPVNAALAVQIAEQLYPAPSDNSLSQVIKYEKGGCSALAPYLRITCSVTFTVWER